MAAKVRTKICRNDAEGQGNKTTGNGAWWGGVVCKEQHDPCCRGCRTREQRFELGVKCGLTGWLR